MPQPVVGCDLSRGFIDLCRLPSAKVERIASTPEAISASRCPMARIEGSYSLELISGIGY